MSTAGFETDEIGRFLRKRPEAKLDVSWDWSAYATDGIADNDWTPETFVGDAAPLTAGTPAVVGSVVTVRLEGGTLGREYWVTHTAVFESGVTDSVDFRVKIVEG